MKSLKNLSLLPEYVLHQKCLDSYDMGFGHLAKSK